MDIELRNQKSIELKELLEFYCGFHGTNYTLLELEEKLEQLFKEETYGRDKKR